MNLKAVGLLLLYVGLAALMAACAGDSESPRDSGTPTYQAETIEPTTEIPVADTPTTVPTAMLPTPSSESRSTPDTSTSDSSGVFANATPDVIHTLGDDPAVAQLTAVCSLDEEAEKITCHANGAPVGSESQLKWGSGISGWAMGPSYEISITEPVHSVIITLELCLDSDCEKVEAYVDTSWVTPGSSGSGSTANTSTSNSSGVYANATPVGIESLTCDDTQITALYTTTCRVELSGQIDYVNWTMEKGDKRWNRDDATVDALKELLVLKKVTTDTIGDYVIPFKACTGGGEWNPSAQCVEQSVTIKVVEGAPKNVGNGIPCESDTNPLFERWIMDEGQTKEIWATGAATHSGTSQHSYTYPQYDLQPNGVPVYAPVDGYLWGAETNLTYSNGVKDYGLQFMVSCEVWIKFGHVVNPVQEIVDLVDSVADENGHGQWFAKPPIEYVNEQVDPIFFKAGDVMFYHLPNRPGTNQGFDYGLFNKTQTIEYLNPARWDRANTFSHALCPWEYQSEPVRTDIKALILPYKSSGEICITNREVVGTIAGMWHFADPTSPVMEGHTLRFGGDLTFVEYFDDLIHVGGLNSKDIGGLGGMESPEEFILRMGPGDHTYVLPQEVRTSHCFEGSNLAVERHPNNFDYMFLYVEIVDDMTINVAFDNGSCPSSLPAEYITFIR